jgi:hypothetical protein
VTGALLAQQAAYSTFWANTPMFSMRQAGVQSVANVTFTQINMDTLDYDTDSGRAAGTPWSYTIPAGMGGRWQFSWKVGWAINATGARLESLFQNGSAVNASQTGSAAAGSGRISDIPASAKTIVVAAGDVMSVWGFQESGGPLNTDAGQSFFEGRLISLATP